MATCETCKGEGIIPVAVPGTKVLSRIQTCTCAAGKKALEEGKADAMMAQIRDKSHKRHQANRNATARTQAAATKRRKEDWAAQQAAAKAAGGTGQ